MFQAALRSGNGRGERIDPDQKVVPYFRHCAGFVLEPQPTRMDTNRIRTAGSERMTLTADARKDTSFNNVAHRVARISTGNYSDTGASKLPIASMTLYSAGYVRTSATIVTL